MRHDFFHRTEGKNSRVKVYVVDLPTADPVEALALAYERKIIPRGSHRRGCFEIQNDRGCWSHRDEKRLNFSKPELIEFTSFED